MKITSVTIANFKAINETTLDLHPTMNVLVGSNGSGKSSVLQALHWMFQSGRSNMVAPGAVSTDPNRSDKASTLSEKDAIYMPSPDYRSAGHSTDYGNNQSKPQLDLRVTAVGDDNEGLSAKMWLKSARNEGISVHVPTASAIVAAIRDQSREFSAYIPGIAGIPLVEEKRSKLLVHRSAAAGDANTVLRNILVLLQREMIGGSNGLKLVEQLVSDVMGEFNIRVDFDEEKHTRILASFQTGAMREADERSYRPLELAGIGYLQVLQIFSYLVYFRPVVLLVDEPDAHLYPIAQERLIQVLTDAAAQFDSQVLLTTHSPSIVRSLPSESKVIWMKGGGVQATGNTEGRQLMGWGLLDRKIVFMSEDTGTHMLRALVAQWPNLERVVAVWPFHGTGKLPPAETIDGLKALLSDDVKVVIHRDRDFMMPPEVAKLAGPYTNRGHLLWVTNQSDIESYWASSEVIASHFGIDSSEARLILDEAVASTNVNDEAIRKMRNKRSDALNKINDNGSLPRFGDAEVTAHFGADGSQYLVLGKSMVAAIRRVAKDKGLSDVASFGKRIPPGLSGSLAPDLKSLLESAIA